ncbi:MAG: hypothetical protein K2X87_01955 [Gemmataceae bacterium]|nr:hypothetical protein [Gemmataceae bacterium]
MRVALVQHSAGSNKAANLLRGLAAIEAAAAGGANLVAFAELGFEPFYPRVPAAGPVAHLAEPIPGPTADALCAAARRYGVIIVANLFERAGDHCFDSSPVIDADGTLLGVTRMAHITDFAGFHEQGYYAPGDGGLPVYATRTGRVGVVICYDRHFPEAMRAVRDADVVIVP